jgi:hypothetical protein
MWSGEQRGAPHRWRKGNFFDELPTSRAGLGEQAVAVMPRSPCTQGPASPSPRCFQTFQARRAGLDHWRLLSPGNHVKGVNAQPRGGPAAADAANKYVYRKESISEFRSPLEQAWSPL